MALIDDKIRETIASHGKLKTLLTVLFAVLSFGKSKAWFHQKDTINK